MNDLTAEQRAKLKRDLAHLDRKSKKEQAIASQDGPGASEIMRREYVRKAARVLKGYKKKAAANRDAKSSAASEAESAKSVPDVAPTVTKTQGTPKETDSQPEDTAKAAPPTQTSLWSLVLAADAGAPEKKESNGWMNDLTAEQRAKLKRDLAHLDKKSKKEQAIASRDGPGASETMRQEYVRKAAHVLKDYKKKAVANRGAKRSAASEAESAKSVSDGAPDVTKSQGTPKETDSQPEGTANRDAKKSAASEAESAERVPDVASRVAKAVGLSGQGPLSDRLPMLCLASFSGIISIGMLAHLGRSALSQSRRRREAALLNDPAPV